MRDGMPGPGWWIASDGRWYPPELHPDVRATAAVVVDDAPPVTRSDGATSISSDAPRAVSNGSGPVAEVVSANGSPVAARDSNGTGATPSAMASATGTGTATATTGRRSVDVGPAEAGPLADAIDTTREPARSRRPRRGLAVGLAAGTLALIVFFARGNDERPSLESRGDTSTGTTIASSGTTPSVSPSVAPGSTAATTAARQDPAPSTATPTTAPPVSTATTAATAATTTTPVTATSAPKVTPKVVSVFDLVKGNCLDGDRLNDGLVTTIRVVDCTEVHTHEVYYSGRYPEPSFDATKISNYANDTCLAQFAMYVGIDYTRSRYQYLHIVPTQESWTRDNDRDVVCVAFDEDSTIVGSIAGRAQ